MCWGQHVPPCARGRRIATAALDPSLRRSKQVAAAEYCYAFEAEGPYTARCRNRELARNDFQKSEADSEAGAFTEALCHIDAENYADNEIHEWNKHQNDPPAGSADDLAPDVEVIDWDDAGPTGLAGFREYFPHRHDQQQGDEHSDNIEIGLGAWPCDEDEYE